MHHRVSVECWGQGGAYTSCLSMLYAKMRVTSQSPEVSDCNVSVLMLGWNKTTHHNCDHNCHNCFTSFGFAPHCLHNTLTHTWIADSAKTEYLWGAAVGCRGEGHGQGDRIHRRVMDDGFRGTRRTYLGGGHWDVEELSPPTLRDCSGEEELEPILREEWRFVLQYRQNGGVLVFLLLKAQRTTI